MVIEFLTAEGSSPIKIHRRTRIAYGEDPNTLSQLDGRSVVVRAVKRASVTGP